MTFIIDRFEGDFAVVEANEKTYNIAKALLPDDAKEGSVIEVKVDKEATEKAKIWFSENVNKSDKLQVILTKIFLKKKKYMKLSITGVEERSSLLTTKTFKGY